MDPKLLPTIATAIGIPVSTRAVRDRVPWWVQSALGLFGVALGIRMIVAIRDERDDRASWQQLLTAGTASILHGILVAGNAYQSRPVAPTDRVLAPSDRVVAPSDPAPSAAAG